MADVEGAVPVEGGDHGDADGAEVLDSGLGGQTCTHGGQGYLFHLSEGESLARQKSVA